MKHWWRVLQFFRPDAVRLGVVFILMVASTATNLLKPWPIAIIVDSVLGNKPWPDLLPAWTSRLSTGQVLLLSAITILLLYLAQGVLSTFYHYLSIKIGLCGLRRVRNDLFARVQRLSWRFLHGTQTGDLIYRASWDTYAFQTAFQQGLVMALTSILSLAFMVVIMSRLNGALTLVAIGTVPLLLLSIKLFGNRMRARGNAAQQADSRVTSLVQQNISALPLIQSYTQEQREQERFVAQTAVAQEKRQSQHAWELLYGLGIAVVFGLGTAAIVWVGSNQVLAGKLTIGELLIFIAYLAQLYDPLSQLSHVGATVATARASTQRIFEVLDAPEEIKDSPDAKPIVGPVPLPGALPQHPVGPVPSPGARNDLSFDHVSFGYDPDRPVLYDISFVVPGGKSAAIIGPSGAGKTTLLRMLPRFYDPTSGKVLLGGIDLRQLRLKDLRTNVAFVFQETILLPATIAENIALGRPDASPAQIETAARAANAHDFIQRLPKKYDTVVGEGAARLSVGEAQRIGLARAFLKDAPILLLDEPTSSLDAQSESAILSSLKDLMRGRTTLLVAHRPETTRGVDKIIVLENGRIVEQGTPAELIQRTSYYADFAKLSGSFE